MPDIHPYSLRAMAVVHLPAAFAGIGCMAAIWLPGELTWTRFIVGAACGATTHWGVVALLAWRLWRR